jgi:hypothetical protein
MPPFTQICNSIYYRRLQTIIRASPPRDWTAPCYIPSAPQVPVIPG